MESQITIHHNKEYGFIEIFLTDEPFVAEWIPNAGGGEAAIFRSEETGKLCGLFIPTPIGSTVMFEGSKSDFVKLIGS